MSLVRTLTPKDRDSLLSHFLALDVNSRRLRFCHSIKDEGLLKYVDGFDFSKDVILGISDPAEPDTLLGVAELRPAGDGVAEMAFSVLPSVQKNGLGKELLGKALVKAKIAGLRAATLMCLPENTGMRHLAGKVGMTFRRVDGDLEGSINLEEADLDIIAADLSSELSANFAHLTAKMLAMRSSPFVPFPWLGVPGRLF